MDNLIDTIDIISCNNCKYSNWDDYMPPCFDCVRGWGKEDKWEVKSDDANRISRDTIYRQDAIDALCKVGCGSGYCGIPCVDVIAIEQLPSAPRSTDEEDQLKFYYVESIDDYWVGRRLDNFYYANWHEGLGFVWSHSRYLPWGKHVVAPETLWKEHTYPSEPKEIPFTEWIVGFMKKYATRPIGQWLKLEDDDSRISGICSICGWKSLYYETDVVGMPYCPNCGAKMEDINE